MKLNPATAAAALALVLALGLAGRIFSQQLAFRDVVNQSLATSEGYDQKFIDLVNHLEDVLSTRASFPFLGGKDPMTGRRREMSAAVLAPAPAPVRKPVTVAASKAGAPAPKADTAPPPDPTDKIRLTAIIADDYGQHTAILMVGERSLSLDVGDTVEGRKVVRITSKEVALEDEAEVFILGLSGQKVRQRK